MKIFLIVAFFIVVGIVKAYNKAKQIPDERDFGGESSGDTNKESFPQSSPSSARELFPTENKPTVRSMAAMKRETTRMNFTKSSIGTDTNTIPQSQTSFDDLKTEQDFNISSPEEAKRAIIWSEILQRKY
ncbi:hypothetical protein EZS27_019349 [termite gut metagenome]|uniref:Uncharacterized protein n=1 Tax=termite gut metagenome TaxID=433724 RepID=A0A5J4RDD8_9ZZZZ